MSRGFVDLVPDEVRREWARAGLCPDRDLYALFSEHCAQNPAKPVVIDEHGEASYAELDDLARRIAAGLSGLGVAAGDVVGVQLGNDRWACAVELALAALGAVALPYPPGRGDVEAASLLGRAGARVAVVLVEWGDFPCAERTRALVDRLPELEAVVSLGGAPDGCTSLEELARAGERFEPVEHDPDGPARILVSSGSEAEPKMVLYSHNALAGGRGRFMAELRVRAPELRNLFLLPLGSSFGAHALPSAVAAHGGTLVLRPRFDPGAVWVAVERHRPHHVFAVPTMVRRLLDHQEHRDASSVRAVVVGGGSLDAVTAQRAAEAFGSAVVNLYGSADGVNCHSDVDGLPAADGSVGRPDPRAAEIRVVDEGMRSRSRGEVGEIIARGPMTPMCYVGSPQLDRTKRADGGWVRTGDAGFLGADGTLTVVGRRDDVIIRGGLNISPAQVEGLINTMAGVTDAVCVPFTDPSLGERMCACVTGDVELSLDDIVEHLGQQGLDRRKFPEDLVVLPRLPLGAAGKVDRGALRHVAETRAVAS